MIAGEIEVWRIRLDEAQVPPPTPDEVARAARFVSPQVGERFLRAHGALRAILSRFTEIPLEFAVTPTGKPYLPGVPQLKFNLSHSHGMALVGVAFAVEVGVDVERMRTMPDHQAIVERFFPPSEAEAYRAAAAPERDFFRRWTRIEAVLKARGVGLYGAGQEPEGEWTIQEIEIGDEYEAAVAAPQSGMRVAVHDF
jgi:4'-phosphopantetheinyl transferase